MKRKKRELRRHNPVAKALREGQFKKRIVRDRTAYTRKEKHKNQNASPFLFIFFSYYFLLFMLYFNKLIILTYFMFSYSELLLRSLKITWKNKYLWFFGVFATFFSATGGYEVFTNILGNNQVFYFGQINNLFNASGWQKVDAFISQNSGEFIILLFFTAVALLLFCFLVWLSVVSQGALASDLIKILQGKTARDAALKSSDKIKNSLTAGMENFWTLFLLNMFFKALMLILFSLIGYGLFSIAELPIGFLTSLSYLLSFILVVALVLGLSFILKYSLIYAVSKRMKFIKALSAGGKLFARNLGSSMSLAFILFAVDYAVILIVSVVGAILAVPILLSAAAFGNIASFVGFWLIISGALMIGTITFIYFGAALVVFHAASWTNLFYKLEK